MCHPTDTEANVCARAYSSLLQVDPAAPRRVRFAPPLVTETRFRPKTTQEEALELFYTRAEVRRFRKQFIAFRNKSRREERSQEEPSNDNSKQQTSLLHQFVTFLLETAAETITEEATSYSTEIVGTTTSSTTASNDSAESEEERAEYYIDRLESTASDALKRILSSHGSLLVDHF